MLAQLFVLLVAVGIFAAILLAKRGYTPKTGENLPDIPITFTVSEDGRSLVDENGFTVAIPDQWVATPARANDQDVPNAYNLHHERADVICNIEVAHGKNATGTSASGLLDYYDPGKRVEEEFRDSTIEIRQVVGTDAAYLGWTGEVTNIRHRQVFMPYPGGLLTLRFTEDLDPMAFGRQPVPCITIFNNLVESGISLPGADSEAAEEI